MLVPPGEYVGDYRGDHEKYRKTARYRKHLADIHYNLPKGNVLG